MRSVFVRRATKITVACLTAVLISSCSGGEPEGGSVPFVISGGPGPATVWAIGDAGHLGERERPVARLIADANPDRLLYLGDVYETGTAEDFEDYDALYGDLAQLTAPTIGNHEFPNRAEGYDPYWEGKKGRTPPAYYTTDIAGWEILSLDSQIFGDDQGEQLSWLRRKVAGPGNCRLAFWHEPRYSAGETTGGGDEPGVDDLWQSVQGKAALVINAHDHNMQRMKPVGGTVQFISGAGGHGFRYPLDEDDPRFDFLDEDHDGALRIRLSPGRATLDFVAVGGEVLDSSEVSCSRVQQGLGAQPASRDADG